MNYNSKEEIIGEFIDLMDTIELDSDKITKDNKEEVLHSWNIEFAAINQKVFDFMREVKKNA